jgi:hypothetical protein
VQYPDLYGLYIFCDYVTGNFWTTVSNGSGNWNTTQLNLNQPNIATFGEDVNGELYAANLSTGEIYHLAGGISLSFNILSSLQIQKIYPNPGSGSFIIENAKDVQKVSVLDATGKVLINFTSDEKKIISFDLSSFAPGIYLVRMVEKNQYVQTEKLILEH